MSDRTWIIAGVTGLSFGAMLGMMFGSMADRSTPANFEEAKDMMTADPLSHEHYASKSLVTDLREISDEDSQKLVDALAKKPEAFEGVQETSKFLNSLVNDAREQYNAKIEGEKNALIEKYSGGKEHDRVPEPNADGAVKR